VLLELDRLKYVFGYRGGVRKMNVLAKERGLTFNGLLMPIKGIENEI
jgi:hypothetical protein